jgi:hypothetical protein
MPRETQTEIVVGQVAKPAADCQSDSSRVDTAQRVIPPEAATRAEVQRPKTKTVKLSGNACGRAFFPSLPVVAGPNSAAGRYSLCVR